MGLHEEEGEADLKVYSIQSDDLPSFLRSVMSPPLYKLFLYLFLLPTHNLAKNKISIAYFSILSKQKVLNKSKHLNWSM